MIYTVTFNPAIDCIMQVQDLEFGRVNRAVTQEFYFGGKGVNVSYVLRNLGRTSTAWGFVAGWTGAALERALQDDGIETGFVHLPAGNTRMNAKLKGTVLGSDDDVETAVNAGGAPIDDASLQEFFDLLDTVQPDDFVILSGGVPKGTPKDIYARIMEALDGRGAHIIVDATEEVLVQSLSHKPFLVKPNDEELAEIVDCDPYDVDALIEGARKLQSLGAENVLVSRGGLGSLLLDETGNLQIAPVIPGTLVNSVGAGDSVVAGFVEGYLRATEAGLSGADAYAEAYKLAQACGSATAFSPWLAPTELVEQLLSQLDS
ncbi:MAG: 1-phosphofructokinase family hexose kinase [Eggerthellaceae bacterium]|nr:1-phosphofructokinase family hexose kinase [Eggerthellaceae bacterium]